MLIYLILVVTLAPKDILLNLPYLNSMPLAQDRVIGEF